MIKMKAREGDVRQAKQRLDVSKCANQMIMQIIKLRKRDESVEDGDDAGESDPRTSGSIV
jgi:hypothetical protein